MVTPSSPTGVDLTSRNGSSEGVSPNSRRPVPSTVGKTISRSSSTSPRSSSDCTSCPLPLTSSSPSSSGISSSVTTRVLFHSGSLSVLETTYLGMLLNLSANPNSSVREGQAAAKPAYVTRPSSSPSAAITSSSLKRSPSSPRS